MTVARKTNGTTDNLDGDPAVPAVRSLKRLSHRVTVRSGIFAVRNEASGL